jgi:hypothetical protein
VRANSEREREVLIRQAKARLQDWVATYRRLVEDAGVARGTAALSAISSLGQTIAGDLRGIPRLLAGLSDVAKITKARRPSWKVVADLECAPAGLIYSSEKVL